MPDIFVRDLARDMTILVEKGETEADCEIQVANIASAFLDDAIYFFAEFLEDHEVEWEPVRWRRAVTHDGDLYAESSDEKEIRKAAAEIGVTPQRLYQRSIVEYEWRDI